MPANGFTEMFEKMLSHPGITVAVSYTHLDVYKRQEELTEKGLTQRLGSDYKEPAGVKFQNVTGGGKSLKQNSSISSMPRYASDSVSLATL